MARRRRPRRRDVIDAATFRGRLLAWGRTNRRSFPWRDTRQPYQVLVAEVLLHRTRASQVVPLYLRFVRRFPSWRSIVETPPRELRRLLRSLGLTWRVDQLHKMAKEIVTRFRGRTPRKLEELESLPGVGHYKAAAVRCFAYGEQEILLDTNTVRVLGRLRGLKQTDASRRSRLYREEMWRLMDNCVARDFNFALLDLAALVCHPRNPDCNVCPVRDNCFYGTGRVRTRSHE